MPDKPKRRPPEEAVALLDALDFMDAEGSHSEADEILLSVLRFHEHYDVAEAYERARDQVGFWYS